MFSFARFNVSIYSYYDVAKRNPKAGTLWYKSQFPVKQQHHQIEIARSNTQSNILQYHLLEWHISSTWSVSQLQHIYPTSLLPVLW